MENQYKRTTTTVSFINYHFVFCPRFRRKIFDIPGVEERFKELVSFICEKNGIEILAMECHHDHAHLFLSCLPVQSPSDVMKFIKRGTSKELRSEFSRLSRPAILEAIGSLVWPSLRMDARHISEDVITPH